MWLSARWLRIHSLPGSKRYPDSEARYAEMLARYNAVATEVLGAGGRCALVGGSYVESSGSTDWDAVALQPGLTLGAADVWGRPAIDEDTYLEFGIAEVEWQAGRFDALLRGVAADAAGRCLFFSDSTGQIYAPYDGGADLILASGDVRDGLRGRWASWLSSRDD